MSVNSLPKYIDPMKLIERQGRVSGQIAVANLLGLQEILLDDSGVLSVELDFDRDEEGFFRIQGSINGELRLECQRCLQAMIYPVAIAVNLSPVTTMEAAKKLPSSYEPLLVEDDKVLLASLVEEELVINLPMIPKHETESCHS